MASIPEQVAWKLMGKEALLKEIERETMLFNTMEGSLYKGMVGKKIDELRALYLEAGGRPVDWPSAW